MSLIIRGSLIAKAHCSTMRALGLIVGTIPYIPMRATMSLTMSLIMRQIVFFKSFETQAAPLPLLTRTATVHTNLGGDPGSA
jgi:hypothetical protein